MKLKKQVMSLLLAGALTIGSLTLASCKNEAELSPESSERQEFTNALSIQTKTQFINVYKYELLIKNDKFYVRVHCHYGIGEDGMEDSQDYWVDYNISSIEYSDILKFYDIKKEAKEVDNMKNLTVKQLELLKGVIYRNQPEAIYDVDCIESLNHMQ